MKICPACGTDMQNNADSCPKCYQLTDIEPAKAKPPCLPAIPINNFVLAGWILTGLCIVPILGIIAIPLAYLTATIGMVKTDKVTPTIFVFIAAPACMLAGITITAIFGGLLVGFKTIHPPF